MLQQLLDLLGGGAAPTAPARPDFKPKRPPAGTGIAQTAPKLIAHDPPLPLADALAPAHFAHPRANRRIALGGVHVAYELRRGRRRTIGFTVGADGLTVSAPPWAAVPEVEAALRQKGRWVVAKLGDARERQARLQATRIDWRDGAALPYLGQPLVLRIDPRQHHGPAGAVLAPDADGRPALHLGLPHGAAPEQLRDVTQAWLMRQARRLFTERLDHFAPQLGVRWQRLGLSSAGTRWGSASADGSIRLNWRLIHFRQPVIDYVVVHELAHLREMNHGPRFWQHVQDVLPDYAERRAALKNEPVPRW
ncbi:SprT family zinc-dependent metalloprotease [Ottowia sp.]|uniref:M48 family metallopeptidase n=1 Tax=Ottowia sp. TaxID=1898956 RepID=UPI0025D23DB7|nr:SprT family zinc-dependent metalloprotease [Ottowia sp.]